MAIILLNGGVKMRQDKKPKDKVAIALVLCFSVVAIASVFTVKSSLDKLNLPPSEIDISDPQTQAEQNVSKPVPTVDSKDNESAQQPEGQTQFEVPVSGSILMEYSNEVPIYSKTLDQYMVHMGIDIEAPLDTQVKAAAAGTVTKVYSDDKYGITIEINHGNGMSTVYSNLSTTKMVEVSDVVKKGQVISGIGDTALFEALDNPHLHFELLQNGEHMNPADYVDF